MFVAARLAAALLLAVPLLAQASPRLSVAFHGTTATSGPPALAWLCSTWLPARSEWPADIRPGSAFVLDLDRDGPRITGTDVPLPANTLATATVALPGGGEILAACAADGTEDWFVPIGATIPPDWLDLLHRLDGDRLDRPRTIDAAVLVGHLLGALPEGDPQHELLQLGAALCGQVTWLCWRTDTHLRVRGRSDGGLLLPALLAVQASARCPAAMASLPLRAFVARDGDRAEAARRLVRTATDAPATLAALLHGDDELRLAAIDTLVRLHAVAHLPRIVAAASPSLPWTTVAAVDAFAELWPHADAAVRQRTREALARSPSPELRRLDTGEFCATANATAADAEHGISIRARSLLLLLLSGLAIYGFWLRERLRLHGSLA